MHSLPLLIVEDDHDLRDALCITLELAGHVVSPAADGSEALAAMARRQFGLVISDIQMEPLDGFGLLREIRTIHPHVPVVLMTAFGDIESAVAAMRSGASDYLAKPFEPASLLELVDRYCMRPQPENLLGEVTSRVGRFSTLEMEVSDPTTEWPTRLTERLEAITANGVELPGSTTLMP